jgi:hypothetical protein
MSTDKIQWYLDSIRTGLLKVIAITKGLGVSPDAVELENALKMREIIIRNEIDGQAFNLSRDFPNWRQAIQAHAGLSEMHRETESLMHSIVDMDEIISINVKKNMLLLESKLSSLYYSSRAAFSYTTQSKLRIGR